MDGKVQGNYRYQVDINGAPSTVKTKVLFDVEATFQGDNGYGFTGTVNFQSEDYRITGTEVYPADIKNWGLQQTVAGFQADVFEGDVLRFKFCSQPSETYGRDLILDVYAGSETDCNQMAEKLGEMDFRYD